MNSFTDPPDAPFSLQAAASFGFGPNTGRPTVDGAAMHLAFVTDDLRHQAAVWLSQDAGGDIHARVQGDPGDGAALEAQVRRILSLDHPAAPWLAVGARRSISC